MKSFSGLPRKRALILSLLLLVVVVIALVLRSPSLPPVMLLSDTIPVAAQSGLFIDRWIPVSWGWLWQVRYAILGKPRVISLTTSIIDLTGVGKETWEAVLVAPPTFVGTNGISVWIADADKLESLRKRWMSEDRILASPGATTAHRMGTAQSLTTTVPIGERQVETGVFIKYMPLVGKSSADLTALIGITAALTNQADGDISIRTNLWISARLQIPQGKGALLLNPHTAAGEQRLGILLSSTIAGK